MIVDFVFRCRIVIPNFMVLETASKFCKYKSCPSAEKLLRFNEGELLFAEMKNIAAHLDDCEFCSSELYFLLNFPQTETNACYAMEIPPALKQLAEVLLGGKQKEFSLLKKLLPENEQTSLKNASQNFKVAYLTLNFEPLLNQRFLRQDDQLVLDNFHQLRRA